MIEERWRPVPGFEGFYDVSSHGRVRGVHRVIIRQNGARYTAQGRMLRPTRHRKRLTVILARGRRGDYQYYYLDKLVETVFGQGETAK